MYNTIEEIAQDIVEKNNLEGLFNPRNFLENRELLIEFPRWIRNRYKLWEDNPLTDACRLSGDMNAHPDAISAKIVERVKCILDNTK